MVFCTLFFAPPPPPHPPLDVISNSTLRRPPHVFLVIASLVNNDGDPINQAISPGFDNYQTQRAVASYWSFMERQSCQISIVRNLLLFAIDHTTVGCFLQSITQQSAAFIIPCRIKIQLADMERRLGQN